MDSFGKVATPNQFVISMFCFMLNFYIFDDMDKVKSVVTEDQIPYMHVKNLPVYVDGWHCGILDAAGSKILTGRYN